MLTVLQANIAGQSVLPRPLGERLGALADIVETHRVNLVAVQAGLDADGTPRPAEALDDLLPQHRLVLRHGGLALLARVPAEPVAVVPLTGVGLAEDPSDRSLLVARVADGPVIAVAHFSWVEAQAQRNIDEAVDALADHHDALIIGDFNQTPQSPVFATLTEAGFDDPWARLHGDAAGFTFEIGKPWGRIDYVLARGGREVRAIERLADTPEHAVSNHALLLATVA